MLSRAVLLFAALSPFAFAQPKADESTLKLGPNDKALVRISEKDGLAGAAFSPDGKRLVLAGGGTDFLLWDVAANKEIRRFTGFKNFIRTAVFSPDGKFIVTAGDNNEAIFWNVETGKEAKRVGKHQDHLRAAVFSPDGKTLATSGFDQHIGIWNVATGKQLHWIHANPRVAYGIAFSPDGRFLVSGGDKEGALRVWSVETGKQVRNWDAHPKEVHAVVFSPDGRLIASGGDGGTAKIWETLTGKLIRQFDGHNGGVTKLAFSPDGRVLASTSHNQFAHFFDVATGKELRRCGNHKGWVWGLAYSPDGRFAVSTGHDGAAVLWEAGKAEAAPAVRFTAAELKDCWRDLMGEADAAFTAANRLAAGKPEEVLPFLKGELKPVKATVDAAKIQKLIGDLDSGIYRVREAASRDLANMGEQAGAPLRQAVASAPSSEARERIQTIIAKLESGDLPPETLRALRVLHIPETMGVPEAQRILEDLAAGLPGDRITQAAKAALERMKERSRR